MKSSKLTQIIKNNRLIVLTLGLLFLVAVIGICLTKFNPKNIFSSTQQVIRCGKVYTIDKIVIENVDITEKINGYYQNIDPKCSNYPNQAPLGIKIRYESNGIYEIVIYSKNNLEQSKDPFVYSSDRYRVNTIQNKIYAISAFDGSEHLIDSFK